MLLTVVYAGCGIICSILQGRNIQDVLITWQGLVFCFLAAGLISRGAIGAGDCWILLALGACMDTETYIRMLCIGFFSGSVLVRDFACESAGKAGRQRFRWCLFCWRDYIGGILILTDLRQIKKTGQFYDRGSMCDVIWSCWFVGSFVLELFLYITVHG